MRISDWSSDVCSSDLPKCLQPPQRAAHRPTSLPPRPKRAQSASARHCALQASATVQRHKAPPSTQLPAQQHRHPPQRSEEHTSELQSLMRISYAVFCLKKKIQTKIMLLYYNLHLRNNYSKQDY